MTQVSATRMAARDFLTIVSGLPRSGTSMMMRMLESGGLPAMADEVRTADDDNPRGYYEFEPVKQTKEDASWVTGSEGKVVKMVYSLVRDMPSGRDYRVLLMRRRMEEILASQRVMLERKGLSNDGIPDEQIAALFESQLADFTRWVAKQPHIDMIEVSYNAIQESPREELARVNNFLGGDLDLDAMANVVEAKLYRNRT